MQAKQQVLVIDDNELVRGSLLSLLKTIGFASARGSKHCRSPRFLAQQPMDAILVDHHLDGENGFEEVPLLFADSRAAQGHVPLLVGMTGSEYLPERSNTSSTRFWPSLSRPSSSARCSMRAKPAEAIVSKRVRFSPAPWPPRRSAFPGHFNCLEVGIAFFLLMRCTNYPVCLKTRFIPVSG